MESAVRYDFSFPPKSSSLNHSNQPQCTMSNFHHHHNHQHQQHSNQNQNNQNLYNHRQNVHRHQYSNYHTYHNSYQNLTSTSNHQNCSLSKSASTSLLSYASQQPASNSHHNNQSNFNNNFCNNCNNKDCSSSNHHHQTKRNFQMASHAHFTQTTPTNPSTPINAATTPKDANCSFTFDDLKNTLAFMDDSPLINHTQSNSTTATSTQLTVIPTECTVAALSSSSSTSSSSGLSNSSCNSCNGSSTCTSPNTRHDCQCNQNHHHQHHHPKSSVLDLLIKKSPEQSSSLSSSSFAQFNFYTPQVSTNSNGLLTTTNASNTSINTAIETAAKKYRSAAQISEATCCWKGKLPAKQYKTPIVYSTKVFVGGLPWDITEDDLIKEFGLFGPCRVEWTNKEKYNLLGTSSQADSDTHLTSSSSLSSSSSSSSSISNFSRRSLGSQNKNSEQKQRSSPGFAYVIYDSEYSVRSLVGNCIEDYQHGRDRVEYYFKISTRRVRNKEVQIIPWILADNNFALCTPKELDPKKTVFVGNLHGTMTARDLAHIMNELFGCVVYAGIDIDKLKYPIGSGRVTFSHQQNFMRAVRAAFVDIQSSKFSKRIQIDPYLEDVQCCLCFNDKGIYFCRDFQCFNYYCGSCWDKQHSYNQQLGNHKPLMRKREEK